MKRPTPMPKTCLTCMHATDEYASSDEWAVCGIVGSDARHYRRTGETLMKVVTPTDTCEDWELTTFVELTQR